MNRLVPTTDAAAVAGAAAVFALAMPPAAATHAFVPNSWTAIDSVVPAFDLEVWANGTLTLTLAELFGGVLHPLVVADDTFTTTHAADTLTAASHGLLTGDGPIRVSSDDTLPDGLTADTDYWIIYVDANTVKLAASLALALAGTAVTFDDDGTGNHTLADVASTSRVHWHSHGLLGSGTIALTNQLAYTVRCEHRPGVVAYGVKATFSTEDPEAVSFRLLPVQER